MLGAVDDEVIAIGLGAGLHRAQVRAGIGLGQAEAFDPLAADRRQQVALDLLALAGAQDVAGPRHRVLQGERGAAELALHQGQRDMVEAAAAQLLRHVGGVEAGLDRGGVDLLDQLRPHLVGALDLFFVRLQLRLDKGADAVDQHLLFRGEAEIHGSRLVYFFLGRPMARPELAGRGSALCASMISASLAATSGRNGADFGSPELSMLTSMNSEVAASSSPSRAVCMVRIELEPLLIEADQLAADLDLLVQLHLAQIVDVRFEGVDAWSWSRAARHPTCRSGP